MGGEQARLARVAARLGRLAARGKPPLGRLPDLWLFTDPDRLPDPLAAAETLPIGAGIVLRTFGRPEVERLAPALADLARLRGLTLLVGADSALAQRIGAHGVHLPQRRMAELPRLRMRHPAWRLTAAAHSRAALRRAEALGAEAVFLSPAFRSASPSASGALGPVRLAALIRGANLPTYALGGVSAATAGRLVGTGAAGVAAVEAFRT